MVRNSLIDFRFAAGDSKYIRVNIYGARWVENIKSNVIRLYKKEIKSHVFIYFLLVISLLNIRTSARLLGFLWGLIQLPF